MILVVAEPHKKCAQLLPAATEIEFMCSVGLKIASVPGIIKNKLKLKESDGLFLFSKNKNITNQSQPLAEIYEQFRNIEDDILYLHYSTVEIFGFKA